MAQGEKDSDHSQALPSKPVRDSGSSASDTVEQLRNSRPGPSFGMRGRIALLIGLLLAATVLYVGLLALLYRDKPHVELMFGAAATEPALDLTLNVVSLDPVREVIKVRIEIAKPSETRWWRSLKPADLRDFVVHVDDRYLAYQIAADGSGANNVLEIGLSGSINEYPLDRYAGRLAISALKKGNEASQPIRLTVWPLVSNWDVKMSHSGQAPEFAGGVDLNIQVNRPTSLIFLAFAFYTAMALIGLSGLTIGTLVFLGVHPVEPGMTGALGAMIFSIPALRGIMPGAPPLGIHADALVLVWVQLAVILGLTLFVITWVSRH